MTGMTGEEVMDIFHGTGRNGKTKFYKNHLQNRGQVFN